jgi:hypothetical protein
LTGFRISESSIQVGAWSLAFAHPRTVRSTSAATSRAAEGLSKKWSMRKPASLPYAFGK